MQNIVMFSPQCSLLLLFQDRNDIPPVFTAVPRPVTLNDDVPIGTTVTTLIATDSDGTSPGNKVHRIY
jgi:protocadherin-15